jgi:hypothetical protein
MQKNSCSEELMIGIAEGVVDGEVVVVWPM